MNNENECKDCIHFKLCKERGLTNEGVMPFCNHFEQGEIEQDEKIKEYFGEDDRSKHKKRA